MKFYPPRIIRFYRHVLVFILVILPFSLAIHSFWRYSEDFDIIFNFMIGAVLALAGALLIHVGFWEKCFSVLILTDEGIQWKCLFRKPRNMRLSECVEVGVYLENANNGFPSEQLYFSDHKYPQQNMNNKGVMKATSHLIKFWYSKELGNYIINTLPSKCTSCLAAYRRKHN